MSLKKRKENTKAVFPGKSKDTKTDIHKSQPGPNLSFSLPLCRETHGEEKRRRKGSSALSLAAPTTVRKSPTSERREEARETSVKKKNWKKNTRRQTLRFLLRCYISVFFTKLIWSHVGHGETYTWCSTRENLYTTASSTDRQSMV